MAYPSLLRAYGDKSCPALISDTETTEGEVLNTDENNEEGENGEERETEAGESSDCPSGQGGVDPDTEQACTDVEELRLTENENEQEEEINLDEQTSPQGESRHLHLELAHDAHKHHHFSFFNENLIATFK